MEGNARAFGGGDKRVAHSGGGDAAAVLDFDGGSLSNVNRHGRIGFGRAACDGHVDGDADVRLEGERGGLCAAAADLLLRGEDGENVVLRLTERLDELDQHGAGAAVVHIGRADALAKERGLQRERANAAHRRDFERLFFGFRADVDEKPAHRVFAVRQRLGINDALRAVFEDDLARGHLRCVHAAQRRYAQEALFVRGVYHQTDGVHVRAEQDAPAFARAALDGDQVAHRVGEKLVHIRPHRFRDFFADGALTAAGAERFEHFKQRILHHTGSTSLFVRSL